MVRQWLCTLIVLAGCQQSDRLNGGGSSFAYPIMLKWSRTYALERGTQVDYQSTGSGNGILQMTLGTVDFGCTDAPLTVAQREKARQIRGEVEHIPIVMGAVVPIYNLPGVATESPLRLSGEVLAGIFLGSITQWDDARIREMNPGVNLPSQTILVVSRSDPSGTTAIFADFISKVAPAQWAEREMGPPGTAVRWPAGEAQKGNEGVSGLVSRVRGSLGYVELKYALDVGLSFAAVRNQAGEFVAASPSSVQTASRNVLTSIPDDFCFSLTNAPGAGSYPISGSVWCVFYRNLDSARLKPLLQFLNWATDESKGQQYALELSYAALPEALIAAIRKRLNELDRGGE